MISYVRRRADARNFSFFILYGGLFTFSTQFLTLNYLLYSPSDAAPQFLDTRHTLGKNEWDWGGLG